ncbi:MAG: HigA family addiction module antidote protein [Candidatus Omnitrophica bacterium]|nr:HigA family addiction module antidote protein [Candidatus Omnitrophota bacterium]
MGQNKKLEPVHPGEVLDQEFLAPLEINQYRLAKRIHVPARRINEIVQGKRAVSADTALRLSKYFGTSAKFWLNLQAQYDLDIQEEKIISKLESAIKPFKHAA